VRSSSRAGRASCRRQSSPCLRLYLLALQELFETWEECARREVEEEMGISELQDVAFCHVTNDIMREEDRHYVTLFMLARTGKEPQNLEPHKCDGWHTYSWEELVQIDSKPPREDGVALFGPLRQLVRDAPSQVLDYLHKDREGATPW
jgi:8-oxo-dGTP diphosphatase